MFPSPVVPSPPPPPPQWYGSIQGGGPWPPAPRGGLWGGLLQCARDVVGAFARRCSCDALQCDLLILQHATSCSAVAIDSARCHDAVCGLQRHNQVPTKCAATRQWQTHFTCYPSGRCGNHGRGGLCGHTGRGGWEPWTPPLPSRLSMTIGGGGGVGGGQGILEHIYIYIYIFGTPLVWCVGPVLPVFSDFFAHIYIYI